jgi:folate-dependent phosphoribosylglycinamide formyltransferase PurN
MGRNLIVFASGTPTDGGTGAANFVKKLPNVNIVIVSNHADGGVRRKADALQIPFYYFRGPYTIEGYRDLIREISEDTGVDMDDWWYALSGWFKKVYWLNPVRTFNIHPAPLPRFAGMYGEGLHRAVWESYQNGEITEGEIVMQFVTHISPKYDDGPIFFRTGIPLCGLASYEEYRKIVRIYEHNFQPLLAELVMRGDISWDGVNPESLITPFK